MFKINSFVSVIFHLTGYRQTINSISKTLLDLSQTFAKQKIKTTTYSNSNPKRLRIDE